MINIELQVEYVLCSGESLGDFIACTALISWLREVHSSVLETQTHVKSGGQIVGASSFLLQAHYCKACSFNAVIVLRLLSTLGTHYVGRTLNMFPIFAGW